MNDFVFFGLGAVSILVLLGIALRYRGEDLGGAARRYFLLHALSLVPVLALVVIAGYEKWAGLDPHVLQSEWRPAMKMALAATSVGASLAGLKVWRILGDRTP